MKGLEEEIRGTVWRTSWEGLGDEIRGGGGMGGVEMKGGGVRRNKGEEMRETGRTKSGTGEELVETVWERGNMGAGRKNKGGGGEIRGAGRRNKSGYEKK